MIQNNVARQKDKTYTHTASLSGKTLLEQDKMVEKAMSTGLCCLYAGFLLYLEQLLGGKAHMNIFFFA